MTHIQNLNLKQHGTCQSKLDVKWRREGGSNPRTGNTPLTVFETAAFDHSAISPHIGNYMHTLHAI